MGNTFNFLFNLPLRIWRQQSTVQIETIYYLTLRFHISYMPLKKKLFIFYDHRRMTIRTNSRKKYITFLNRCPFYQLIVSIFRYKLLCIICDLIVCQIRDKYKRNTFPEL